MDDTAERRRIRLRRPDRCSSCQTQLAIGEQAIWHRRLRTVTCLACEGRAATAEEGVAGTSALREYQRRRDGREQHALGRLIARLAAEPQHVRAWRQGGAGEVRAAARLTDLLRGHGVELLHDRRIPGRGRANIDHVAIGPGGVTVIDTKTHRGKVRVRRIGGLFSSRRSILVIAGRDRTTLIDGVERQIDLVQRALSRVGVDDVDVRGALCFPDVTGLPILATLTVRGIIVDGPRQAAKLAARPGPLDPEAIERISCDLRGSFPPA